MSVTLPVRFSRNTRQVLDAGCRNNQGSVLDKSNQKLFVETNEYLHFNDR